MKVITHKIELQDLSLSDNFAALAVGDAIERWEFNLPIDRAKIRAGKSLTDALRPIVYCRTGRNLHWSQIPTSTQEELDANLFNTDTLTLTAPFMGFLPYAEVAV
jgi:hypothetical protein